MLEFSIVTISAFAAAGNECVKLIASVFKKDWNKYLPIISLVIGLGLGIAGYFLPGVSMGNNIVEAIFIGLAAGASATGVHQVGHQRNSMSYVFGVHSAYSVTLLGFSIRNGAPSM